MPLTGKAPRLRMALLMLLGCLSSCDKETMERALPVFGPAAADAQGGTWRTIVLESAAEVNIPAAATTGSAAYLQEISQIVQLQASLMDTDRVLINQWKGSGILRWNEKLRTLAAKYNQPPDPDADSVPAFSFADPAYAARAYTAFHVAVYDALVSCWHYKFLNMRPQPAVISGQVRSLEPYQIELPGYPSEDAAVAQVGYRLLKTFFPQDSAALLEMANAQKRAKLLSGIATFSDIAAGEAIADFVAEKVLDRLQKDGLEQALRQAAQWERPVADTAPHTSGGPRENVETPRQPPAFFDDVTLWTLSPAERDSLRPGPPPLAGSPAFNRAQEELLRCRQQPSAAEQRIAKHWADSTGTSTPAGHWNEIACATLARQQLSELRLARALCLLNLALYDAGVCALEAQAHYAYLQPALLPAGRSCRAAFAGAAATVLGYLFPADAQRFSDMAREAGLWGVYSGMQYRFEADSSLQYGKAIGGFAIRLGQTDGSR